MVNIVNENGIQVDTLNETVTNLTTGLREIYGNDINVEQNSPDGQAINIHAQAISDVHELIKTIFNSYNPNNASGVVLDERVSINNIQRSGGTFTTVPITLTIDRTIAFDGLDADFNNISGGGYTVQDDAGNQFILIDSVTLVAGDHIRNFRAKNIGQVEVTSGTIVNAVTIVNGVTNITNASGALVTGTNEETDAQLRVRRAASVSNAASGYLNGLRGRLLGLDGVTSARVYENITNIVDASGIPAHGIWSIVEGGANTEIANQIFMLKTAGANMKGDVTVDITTISGGTFTARFDRPLAKDLHIRFDIQTTVTGTNFDEAAIKTYIVNNLTYNIGDFAETARITSVAFSGIDANGDGGVPINVEISDDDTTFVDYLTVDLLNEKWTIADANIDITVIS